MSKDYYKVLNIEKNASTEEIKKAFRKKAHEFHPDKPGGDEAKFKEANEAYQVLGNPERKKQYDQFGTSFEGFGGQAAYNAGFNWEDMFRQGGGGFSSSNAGFDFNDLGDIFGDIMGGQRRTSGSRRMRGSDMEARFAINLEDSVFGTEKVLDISKDLVCEKCKGNGAEPKTKIIECKTCQGQGRVNTTQSTFFGSFNSVVVCPDCQGEGKSPEKKCTKCQGDGITRGKERVKITIPAGISNGETLRLTGKGSAGLKGAEAGDLYIVVQVLPHNSFKREGDNLYTQKTIKLTQAVLGDKVKIKTLDGEVNLKIPAGTSSSQQFSIKDKGSHKLRGRGRGNLIVEVKVDIPYSLSRKQKKLINELEKAGL